MPIQIIAIIQALAAGGSLVPHAAGGLIVTLGSSGYVAGTYLSTSALAAYLTAAGVTAAAGIWTVLGLSGLIGSAGFMGSTIGANGLVGWLMGIGILPSTPIWIPILTVISGIGIPILLVWTFFKYRKTIQKIYSIQEGEEIIFTDTEARMVEKVLLLTHKQSKTPDDRPIK